MRYKDKKMSISMDAAYRLARCHLVNYSLISVNQTTSEPELTRARRRPLVLILLISSTLTVMAGATIAPTLPTMEAAFSHIPHSELLTRLVLTIPALFIVLGSPLIGLMVDRIGRKPVLMAATLLYGVAGASGSVLPSLYLILAGRALLGIAVAGVMTAAMTLIADYFVGRDRQKIMGWQIAAGGFGGVLFLLSGGLLADLDWRFPFLIYLIAWALLPFHLVIIREPSITESGESAGLSLIRAMPISFLAMIYGFVFMTMGVFYMIPVHLPFYLPNVIEGSASTSALAIAFTTLSQALTSTCYGYVRTKLSSVQIMPIGFCAMGVGYLGIGLAHEFWVLAIALVVGGIGMGLIMPNLAVWLSNAAPAGVRGRAMSGLTFSLFLGQFLSPILSQPLISAFSLAAAYQIVGGLLLLLIPAYILGRGATSRWRESRADSE